MADMTNNDEQKQESDGSEKPELDENEEGEAETPLNKAFESSPVFLANASSVSLSSSEITVSYATQVGNQFLPAARIALSHENFLSNIEMLLPYYTLLSTYYGDRRPRIDWESSEYARAIEEANKPNVVRAITEKPETTA